MLCHIDNVNTGNEFLCVVQSHAFELSWTGGGRGGGELQISPGYNIQVSCFTVFFNGFQMDTSVNCFWFEHRFRSSLVVAYMLHAMPMCHRPSLSERLLVVCGALQVCAAFLENYKKGDTFSLWPAPSFATVKFCTTRLA